MAQSAPSPAAASSPFLPLFRRYLREQGLPITGQRELIADLVFATPGHLSVDEIQRLLQDRGQRIGTATIYRTVEILVRSGLVQEHDFGEGFRRYENLFGGRGMHEHLICVHCSRVVEFASDELARVQAQAARAHGFKPIRHRLDVYGLCGSCQAAGVQLPEQGLTCPVSTLP